MIETLQVDAELTAVTELFRQAQPQRILEIGVYQGGTLRVWLENSAVSTKVVAVDPAFVNPERFVTWEASGKLVRLVGMSQDPAIMEKIRDHGPYDWIFIDGEHLEAHVEADVRFARSILEPGGMILLHDIDSGGSQTTGPRNVFDRIRAEGFACEEIIEDPTGTDYQAGAAHGIGVVYL